MRASGLWCLDTLSMTVLRAGVLLEPSTVCHDLVAGWCLLDRDCG